MLCCFCHRKFPITKQLVDIDADANENLGVRISKTGQCHLTIPIIDTVARLRLPSNLNPTIKGKIDAFRTVEAEIKPRVIASWERYDKLASVLNEKIRTT